VTLAYLTLSTAGQHEADQGPGRTGLRKAYLPRPLRDLALGEGLGGENHGAASGCGCFASQKTGEAVVAWMEQAEHRYERLSQKPDEGEGGDCSVYLSLALVWFSAGCWMKFLPRAFVSEK